MIGRWFQIVVEQSFHQKETWQSLQLLKLTKDLTCAEQFINLGHETASKPFLLLKVLFLEWCNTVLDVQKKIFLPTAFRWDHVFNAWIPKDQSIDWKVEKKGLNFVIWFVVVESTFMSLQSLEMESVRKLSNFNFQWTKTLYQNNLKHIACFFTFFKG